jgi:hypothetical protein
MEEGLWAIDLIKCEFGNQNKGGEKTFDIVKQEFVKCDILKCRR